MSQEDIREIVRLTINELAKRKMLKLENYNSMLYAVEPKLKEFFKNKKDKKVRQILSQLSDDPYIDVIYLQYRDNKTLDKIAEYMEKDVSTIKRNKKRLIMSIYEMLEEQSMGEKSSSVTKKSSSLINKDLGQM